MQQQALIQSNNSNPSQNKKRQEKQATKITHIIKWKLECNQIVTTVQEQRHKRLNRAVLL